MGTYFQLNIGVVTESAGQARGIAMDIENHARAFDMHECIKTEDERIYTDNSDDQDANETDPRVVRIKIHCRATSVTLCQVIVWNVLKNYSKLQMEGYSTVYGYCQSQLEDYAWVAGLPEQWAYWPNLKRDLADVTKKVLAEN